MKPNIAPEFLGTVDVALSTGGAAEQENLQLSCLQSVYKAIVEGDYALAFSQMTDDVEFAGSVAETVFKSGKGKEEVVAASAYNYGLLLEQSPEILSIVSQGETVVVIAKERGVARATNRVYECHFVQQFTFRGGKIAKIFSFSDGASLVRAALPGENESI